jgi:hypothetical protein
LNGETGSGPLPAFQEISPLPFHGSDARGVMRPITIGRFKVGMRGLLRFDRFTVLFRDLA